MHEYVKRHFGVSSKNPGKPGAIISQDCSVSKSDELHIVIFFSFPLLI